MDIMNYGGGEAMDLPQGVFLMQSENNGSLCSWFVWSREDDARSYGRTVWTSPTRTSAR
jgi:hypothetical protein